MEFVTKSQRHRTSSPVGSLSNGYFIFRKPEEPFFVPHYFSTPTRGTGIVDMCDTDSIRGVTSVCTPDCNTVVQPVEASHYNARRIYS